MDMHPKDRQHRNEFSKFVEECAGPGHKRIMGNLNRQWSEWNKQFFDREMVVPYKYVLVRS